MKQKQEQEIGNELNDWELGWLFQLSSNVKMLCTFTAFLDS